MKNTSKEPAATGAAGSEPKKATGRAAAPAEALADPNAALAAEPDSGTARDAVIAARSQDVKEAASSEHRKVFVIPKNPLSDDYGGETHAANIDAMRQAMLRHGLRPTEDGHFVGAEDHPDGQSVCLTYACACVPAAVATVEQNVVAVTVADQHALEEKTDG